MSAPLKGSDAEMLAAYRLAVLRTSDARAQAQTEATRASVAAFKALGGGWQPGEYRALAAK